MIQTSIFDTIYPKYKITRLALYDVLVKLDKIKNKLLSDTKVSKQEILKIIDGGNDE